MAKLIISSKGKGGRPVVIGRTVLESRREWALLQRLYVKVLDGTVTAGELDAAAPIAERRLCVLDRRLGR